MGMCSHGLLRVIISDIPQVEKIAETAEEEKAYVTPTILNLIRTSLSLINFLFIYIYIYIYNHSVSVKIQQLQIYRTASRDCKM